MAPRELSGIVSSTLYHHTDTRAHPCATHPITCHDILASKCTRLHADQDDVGSHAFCTDVPPRTLEHLGGPYVPRITCCRRPRLPRRIHQADPFPISQGRDPSPRPDPARRRRPGPSTAHDDDLTQGTLSSQSSPRRCRGAAEGRPARPERGRHGALFATPGRLVGDSPAEGGPADA